MIALPIPTTSTSAWVGTSATYDAGLALLAAAVGEDDEGVLGTDGRGRPVLANAGFIEILGLDRHDIERGRRHLLAAIRSRLAVPSEMDAMLVAARHGEQLDDLVRLRDGRIIGVHSRPIGRAPWRRSRLWKLRDVTALERGSVHAQEVAVVNRLLAAVEHRDDETASHTRRIGLCAATLARAAGWDRERAAMLETAGAMHDVGKIGVPDAILHKRGQLTATERDLVRTHTVMGGAILRAPCGPVLTLARQIALHHHEWWDGTGYPLGLEGEAIPEAARIVALVDVYDALVHDRVYRPALTDAEALAMMHELRGRQFDPRLFDLFIATLPKLRRIRAGVPEQDSSAGRSPCGSGRTCAMCEPPSDRLAHAS